jgi:hypothetical protein
VLCTRCRLPPLLSLSILFDAWPLLCPADCLFRGTCVSAGLPSRRVCAALVLNPFACLRMQAPRCRTSSPTISTPSRYVVCRSALLAFALAGRRPVNWAAATCALCHCLRFSDFNHVRPPSTIPSFLFCFILDPNSRSSACTTNRSRRPSTLVTSDRPMCAFVGCCVFCLRSGLVWLRTQLSPACMLLTWLLLRVPTRAMCD